jgi:hypothetical protein
MAWSTEGARGAKDAGEFAEQRHAMDYQGDAYLQLGQDAKAKALIDDMAGVTGLTETYMPGPYALAISPARYVVERGDWKAAANLQVRPNPLPQVQAITYTARALGAARSGNPEAAKAEIEKLVEFRDKLRDAKDAYWQNKSISSGGRDRLGSLCRESKMTRPRWAAADAEDKTESIR